MAFLTLPSGAETVFFITCLGVGMCMMIGVSTVTAAPGFMLNYYQYVAGSQDAVPRYGYFWGHVLTIYSTIANVIQLVLEPTNVTPLFNRFSMLARLLASAVLLLLELLIVMIAPHFHGSEEGAVAAVIVASILGGTGRAYFGNTGFALAGAAPPNIRVAAMAGLPVAGCLASTLEIILFATMPNTYEGVMKQSVIYFSIAIFVVVATSVLLLTLPHNSVARAHISEFRATGSFLDKIYRRRIVPKAEDGVRQSSVLNREDVPVTGAMQALGEGLQQATELIDGEYADLDKSVTMQMSEVDENQATTAEVLEKAQLMPVLRKTFSMMLSCAMAFFVACLMSPGVLIAPNITDPWFTTLVIATMNYTDLLGRAFTLSPKLWAPRWTVLPMSLLRIIFIPLLLLCATHIIRSEAVAYVLVALFGLSMGYVGCLSVIYAPLTPGLNEGEQILAGQCIAISLMVGVAFGCILQLAVVIPLD